MGGFRSKQGTGSPLRTPVVAEPGWKRSSIAQRLLGRKHSLLVMLSLYDQGSVSTSGLIRELNAHPATVIGVLRDLERLGILRRLHQLQGRHELRASLTLKGMELIETPLYRWGRLARDWDRLP